MHNCIVGSVYDVDIQDLSALEPLCVCGWEVVRRVVDIGYRPHELPELEVCRAPGLDGILSDQHQNESAIMDSPHPAHTSQDRRAHKSNLGLQAPGRSIVGAREQEIPRCGSADVGLEAVDLRVVWVLPQRQEAVCRSRCCGCVPCVRSCCPGIRRWIPGHCLCQAGVSVSGEEEELSGLERYSVEHIRACLRSVSGHIPDPGRRSPSSRHCLRARPPAQTSSELGRGRPSSRQLEVHSSSLLSVETDGSSTRENARPWRRWSALLVRGIGGGKILRHNATIREQEAGSLERSPGHR